MTYTKAWYEGITDFLSRYHATRVFEQENIRLPVVHYAPDAEQVQNVDSILGKPPRGEIHRDKFYIYDYGYLHTVQNQASMLFDGRTFALHEIRQKPLRITARIGSYYDNLATCHALANELMAWQPGKLARFPNRAQYHLNMLPRSSLKRGAGRSAAIGLATLLVVKRDGEYWALLAQRSEHVADNPLFHHVLPAMMFQPLNDDFASQWKLSDHIKRELLEELFGVPEVHDHHASNGISNHPVYAGLQQHLQRGSAKVFLTGIVMNLMTLRPEICTVLQIDDEDWFAQMLDKHAQPNDEVAGGNLLWVPVDDPYAVLSEDFYLQMPPQGASAFLLGMEQVQK